MTGNHGHTWRKKKGPIAYKALSSMLVVSMSPRRPNNVQLGGADRSRRCRGVSEKRERCLLIQYPNITILLIHPHTKQICFEIHRNPAFAFGTKHCCDRSLLSTKLPYYLLATLLSTQLSSFICSFRVELGVRGSMRLIDCY